MKRLINKPNVDGVSAAYPFGNMRDRSSGVQGSEMNTEFHTDYVQFFEKMFDESGLTANGLPDNFTNGFQLFDAARIAIKGYKSYVALISQTGTSDPTAIVLVNEIGSLTLVRAGVGYYGISGTPLNEDTVYCSISTEEDTLMFIKPDTGVVEIRTKDLGTVPTDGMLDKTRVEIRAYF